MIDENHCKFTDREVAAAEEQIVHQSKRIEFYLTEFSVEVLASKMKNGDFEVPDYQREDTWEDWRKKSGQTYASVYGRMKWDARAPTIATQCFGYGNGRFGHPEQDRAISLRDAAILQTFPENYRFLAPGERFCFSKLGRLIGNAVPVQIGEVVAQSLLAHVQKYPKPLK